MDFSLDGTPKRGRGDECAATHGMPLRRPHDTPRLRHTFATATCRAVLSGVAFWLCAAAPPVQSYDTYKSWLVACDNTLRCEAKGFNREGGSRAEFAIFRDAGPRGKLRAVIAADQPFDSNDIKLDGRTLSLPAGWTRAGGGDVQGFTTSSLAVVRNFVQQVRNGTALDLPGDDTTIPLDGLTAALRRMDERQGRVAGETAFLTPGTAPSEKVPAALPVPHIRAHAVTARLDTKEEAALIARTRRSAAGTLREELCDADPYEMEPMAYALDQRRALVLIPCGMGAYQGWYVGFLADRSGGDVHALKLPLPYQGDDPDHGMISGLTEVEFAPTNGTLSVFDKGRGLADCGLAASWVWDGENFRLAAASMQNECGGAEPGDWPVLFRSTN